MGNSLANAVHQQYDLGGGFRGGIEPSEGEYTYTHFASNTGTATYTAATNIGTPCSITTAFDEAVAGDIVGFRAGTYDVGEAGGSYEGAIKPTNSGTAGNHIIFANYQDEVVILNGEFDGEVGGFDGSSPLGVNNVSYITLDGFKLTTDDGLYYARLMLGSQTGNNDDPQSYGTGNVLIRNMDIGGGSTDITLNDNIEGIRFENARDITVQNCYIYDFVHTGANFYHGTNGVKSYNGNNIIIENCKFVNCSGGVYCKSWNRDWDIRNNFFVDCGHCIESSTNSNICVDIRIYNNIGYNYRYSGINASGKSAVIDGTQIYNNTMYSVFNFAIGGHGTPLALEDKDEGSVGIEIYNNLMVGRSTDFGTHQIALDATYDVHDFNLYSAPGETAVMYTRLNASRQDTYTTISALRAGDITGLDSGLHSQDSDFAEPIFTNGNGDFSEPSDFALTAQSPGYQVDSIGNDIGANVTTVGIQ